jgi:hypothetical protein
MESLVVEISGGGHPDEGATAGLSFDHCAAGVEEAVGSFGEFPAFRQALDDGSADAAQRRESHDSRKAVPVARLERTIPMGMTPVKLCQAGEPLAEMAQRFGSTVPCASLRHCLVAIRHGVVKRREDIHPQDWPRS